VWLAERDGALLAAALPLRVGDTAYYMYGASATVGREHMASYLVQWSCLEWARARGATRYDWWGGPTTPAIDDPLAGVGRFKEGFGAILLERLGAWDLPVDRVAHALYERLTGLRRRMLRAGPL
jgi:lipid II:glycine glycyltransferase (peptidoglycan interpeptide bridge formation enzyme)